jgi:hypothetical protein
MQAGWPLARSPLDLCPVVELRKRDGNLTLANDNLRCRGLYSVRVYAMHEINTNML